MTGDPYNRDGPNEKTFEALERAWKACLADTTNVPTEIYCTPDVWEMLNGRRSITFYPYGDNTARFRHPWWKRP